MTEKIPQQNILEKDGISDTVPSLPSETVGRIHYGLLAKLAWEAVEAGKEPFFPKSQAEALGIIDALEFVKGKNTRHYTSEEHKIQYAAIDEYIKRLRTIE